MRVLLLGLFIAIADQVTKFFVRKNFGLPGDSVTVLQGLFNLTYVRNSGAAWGMLSGANTLLSIFSIVILVLLVVYRKHFLSNTWEHRIAMGLMVGGILGNLMDRVRLGHVTDFLDFHWHGHHWPSFNIADAAICVEVQSEMERGRTKYRPFGPTLSQQTG